MEKILGSRQDISNLSNKYISEFFKIIDDIINLDEFKKLENYNQHGGTSRLQHSLNVAYYSYRWSKKAKLDYVSATRGALLHDFFLYDRLVDEAPIKGSHPEVHPQVALINAKKYFTTNETIDDCILHHMWPLAKDKPLTKEGYIVQAADKYCATLEASKNSYLFVKPRVKRLVMTFLTNN